MEENEEAVDLDEAQEGRKGDHWSRPYLDQRHASTADREVKVLTEIQEAKIYQGKLEENSAHSTPRLRHTESPVPVLYNKME